MFYCFWGLVIVAHTPPFIYSRLIVFFFLKTFHGLLTAPRNKTTKFTPPAQMQNYEEIPNYSSPHTHTHTLATAELFNTSTDSFTHLQRGSFLLLENGLILLFGSAGPAGTFTLLQSRVSKSILCLLWVDFIQV